MNERSVAHGTYVIERTYPVALGRTFAALGLETTLDWLIKRRSLWEKRLDRFGRFPAESEDN